jgi:hypothetical protein
MMARTSEHFQINTCRPCGKLFWEGYSSAGFLTRLDVQPLDVRAELIAKLTGWRTYQIHPTAVSFEATPRIGILAKNALVLAQHKCDPSEFVFGEVEPPDYFKRKKRKPTESEGVPF